MFFQENGQYRCAVYLRLSRSDGDQQESNSIKNQRALLNDYLGKHPELHKVDEYVDDGYSGTNFERPDFKRMIQDIENRKINCIIVKDLSRFGRNYIETGRYLERIFPFMGVRFIAINDHYDSAEENDDKGRILIPFNNLINDTYCRDISMRVRSHLDVKRKEGQFIGSFAGYGYQKDPKDKNHLIIDGMARKFDAVVVDSIFRCGRTLPFAIEALQRTFYPLGIQFAVVEDDFCSIDKTAEEVAEYFNGKTIDKIRSEFITNRQNHFEEGTLTHRQAKYGYALSEDRRSLVLNPESAQVVKLIFQMYLEDMKIPEIARALDVQGVQTPQVQMAKKKRSRTKNKWQDSTIRSILKNPLYIGKCTLTLAKAKRELEVPAIVSKTEFQKAQKKLESTRLPSRKKARKKPNLLFKKIYDKESGKGLLCRTSEDESQQIYSFDKGYRCFSGKAPFIESEKIFREILSALEKEKMQAAHIDRVLDLNPEKVKQCMDAGLLQYRKRANEIVAHLMAKDDERTAVYRQYEQGSILLEQVEEYEHQYQVAVQKQEAAFKKVMLAVNDIEKAFSHGNPWLMKFRAISIPEKLERTHLKEWLDHVWIVDFEQVEVILQESEWKRFFPEEWLNNGEEDCNGKKE